VELGPNDLSALLDQGYRDLGDEPDIPRAAVATAFRSGPSGTEVLFIQRATKPTDPWSGQMAFPGGRREPVDPSPEATAAREAMEEVGLILDPSSNVGALGRLDGGRANRRPIIVSAHAWWVEGPRPELTPNHEVADVVWVPLADLADRSRYIDYLYPLSETTFPGIQLDVDDQVVWGLTLRLLSDLFDRLDHPFIIPFEG
jgi:8-oxo-dGTP pyrophosphatase MutT (NUDIX family)